MKKEEGIFKILSQKPWEASQAVIDNNHDGKTFGISKAKLGVRTIMTVSTVIFSLFIVAYADRMLIHDWRSMPEPWLLWVNTAVLIMNSYFFHNVKISADQNNNKEIKRGLYTVGFLAYSFLIGQLIVWYQLMSLGYFSIKCCKCFFLSFYNTTWSTFIRWLIFLGKSYFKVFKRKL